jgi:hypothetical protein
VVLDNPAWLPPVGQAWRRHLCTEDAAYAVDPQQPDLESDGTAVAFSRPGAIVFVAARSSEDEEATP